MFQFKQKISEKEYQKAISIHYFAYGFTFFAPVLGAFLMLFCLVLLIFIPEQINVRLLPFLFLLSILFMLRPYFYVRKVLKGLKTSKIFAGDTNFTITDDDRILVESNGNTSDTRLSDFLFFRNHRDFIFLYISDMQYLLISKKQMREENIVQLIDILNRLGVREKK